MRKAILLTLLVSLLTACSRTPERAEIIGSYVLDNSSVKYTLALKNDGTYIHAMTGTDGKVISKSGEWEWDAKEDDNEIALDDFEEFPGEDIGSAAGPGIYCTSPSYYWGRIRLRAGGDDKDHHFIKQNQE